MGLYAEDADPAFEALLSQFQQVHQNGLARLRIHADAAVAIVQENLAKVYGVKHLPVTAGYKDPEKAVRTLRRRQRERITLGELSVEIERRGEVWAKHSGLQRKGGQQKELQRLHKQIEQNGAILNDKSTVFPGYKATHVIICHKDSHPVGRFDDAWNIVIEVQIGTVAMYDWSEIEHDIVYKPQEDAMIPDDAKRILDMINGVTIIGDMMKDHFRNLLDPLETNQVIPSRGRSRQELGPVHILNERDRDILRDFGGTDPAMDKIRIEETKGSLT
ncbi:hypothetical protein NPX13_g10807 [Xylaria arbuscula]|uniref:RelA/SpoT domain-containing protein n=1 Tax=Xylaria arbuscula TaxID=114810 RepID=A0A9W8TG96_9PEZI|nr:hypothetical protein NPX13_g10807 [Xylaria arbuscula]